MQNVNHYKFAMPIGLIPIDWDVVTVHEVTTSHKQGFYTTNSYDEVGNARLLRITDLLSPSIEYDNAPRIVINEKDFESFKVNPGDFLIGRSGAIGRYGICYEDQQAVFASYLIRFRFDQSRILNEFFGELYSSHLIAKQLELITQGSSNQNINADNIKSLTIPLPHISEQERIVNVLITWDEAVRTIENLIAAKAKYKRGLMQQLLTGKKRFKAFEGQKWQQVQIADLFEEVWRYEKWDETALYNLVSIRRRGGGLFSRGALLGQQIKVKKLKSLRTGDFLISKRQVVHGAWGLVTPEYNGMMVSDEYDSLVVKNPEHLSVEFFTHLSQLPSIRRLAALACNGVHIEKLIFDWDYFRKNHIAIPPSVEEQRRISEVLNACDKEIELLKKQLDALKRQKRGLMQKLLTGQIRVKVDDVEAVTAEAS